ncbi:hypothetical protein BZA05DRAFT_384433 [Tricharina praecox]|uniref:uncharacterized protein n=1 Tax=Tricharina praecox TaxID=43433 RepID=UPI00221F9966|nr:uncharacterized protein BZA05DRAFT_384433 [Tricharina praecox]KAI5857696.1 hypothetical protein BZA05DRAFT_384433 [Tricharina praecox]
MTPAPRLLAIAAIVFIQHCRTASSFFFFLLLLLSDLHSHPRSTSPDTPLHPPTEPVLSSHRSPSALPDTNIDWACKQ